MYNMQTNLHMKGSLHAYRRRACASETGRHPVPGGCNRARGFPAGRALSAADYSWPVVRVVDGDTVKVDASADLPPELASLSVRLRGVDTPEKGRRAKCDAEKRAGRAATDFTQAAVAGAESVIVRDPAWGKWGGRVIADLVLDGYSLSSTLIEAGHGRAYDGGRRKPWCAAKPRGD